MSKAVQLELVYSGGTFTFDVEGEFLPRWEPVHKLNANPPVVVAMRKVWELRQCRFVSTTVAGLWTEIGTLDTAMLARGTGHPTAARLIRDPASANATITTLGPSTYEQFLVEGLEGETDALAPHASWRTVGTFTIRCSAVKKNEDANGIVAFDQQVSYSYERGLARVRWRTTLTTAEGTDARTKAATYAALDVTDFGSDYTYTTNGPSGIDYEATDADEQNSRTPTVVVAVSEVKAWGITVGTTGPGAYPDEVGYSTRTTQTAKKTRTEIVISAEGPGYESWVRARIPTGPLSEDELFVDTANRVCIWTGAQEEEKDKDTKENGRRGEVRVELTGGHRARDFEPVAGGYEPVKFVGGFAPWTAIVSVSVERVGGTGKLSEMKLPGFLGEPWVLIENESTEGEPFLEEEARKVDDSQDTWRREARLVYRSASPPSGSVAAEIAAATPVSTYLLPHAV